MVKKKIYECKLCNLCTHLKTDFTRHQITKKHKIRVKMDEELKLNKKNHKNESKMNPNEPKMNPNEPKMNPDESKKTYKCKFCNKIYSTNSHMNRHLKKCSTIDLSDNTKVINYINELEKENKQIKKKLRKVVEKLIDNCCVTNINNNSNNNTINMQQQNIIINSYGKENLDYLTKNYLTGLVYKPFDSVQSLLKTIHFNPKHPENHNIKISNKKEKYANVYNSGNWEFKSKKEVIENIVDNGYNIMECHFEDIKKDIEYMRRERFSNFQDKYDTDPNIKKNIESDIEMLILNKNDTELSLGT